MSSVVRNKKGMINYEFENIGIMWISTREDLMFDTDSDEDRERKYHVVVEFESTETGAMYRASFNEAQIRGMSTILQGDLDLIDEFLGSKPVIKILPSDVMAEFCLRVGSRLYRISIQIPKYIPQGSVPQIIELQQKNNLLMNRIRALEEKSAMKDVMFTEYQKMNARFYMNYHYNTGFYHMDDVDMTKHCIDMIGENPLHFEKMLQIMSPTYPACTVVVKLLKNIMPRLKQYITNDKKTVWEKYCVMFQCIDQNKNDAGKYVDILLLFCQTGIPINYCYTDISTDISYNDESSKRKLHYQNILIGIQHILPKNSEFIVKIQEIRTILDM